MKTQHILFFPLLKNVNKKHVFVIQEIEMNLWLELLQSRVSDSVCGSEGGLSIQIRLDINKYGNAYGFLIVSLIWLYPSV